MEHHVNLPPVFVGGTRTTKTARILFNQTARMSRAWEPGDLLTPSRFAWPVYTGPVDDGWDCRAHAQLADLFADANAEDRPNGSVERSACVGDVILLPDGTAWTVCPVGFRQIDMEGQS